MRNNGLKKLLAGLSAACLAAAAMPAVSYAAETADTAAKAVVGDSNCDGSVDMSDVVLIMQAMANPNKFGLGGTDEHAITEQGWKNADCNGKADGVSTDDALAIQLYLLGKGEIGSGKTDEQPPAVEATKIHLKNTSITVEGENATVEGTKVTITHSGEFYIDGTLDDGQINVNIPDEKTDTETVKIFLNGRKDRY
ncbi:dockerin type I repeat-containing protein [Ruminococcus flavefaciens]|uniref:dockerin type I repeat-containing protein n=1 Tax=Ruminococcus flavefaciens TaxID=1265 RepID=UPI0013DAD90B|nr:carbohydrate-binding domain-containing protein [Ruminococcus flavefaciens]